MIVNNERYSWSSKITGVEMNPIGVSEQGLDLVIDYECIIHIAVLPPPTQEYVIINMGFIKESDVNP